MCLSTVAIKLNSVLVQNMWVFAKTVTYVIIYIINIVGFDKVQKCTRTDNIVMAFATKSKNLSIYASISTYNLINTTDLYVLSLWLQFL